MALLHADPDDAQRLIRRRLVRWLASSIPARDSALAELTRSAMRAEWVEKNPRATRALLMAIFEAQIWCDKPENKRELAELVGKRQWINAPVPDILGRISGDFNFGHGKTGKFPKQMMKYWTDHASFPWTSHDQYLLPVLVTGFQLSAGLRSLRRAGSRCQAPG